MKEPPRKSLPLPTREEAVRWAIANSEIDGRYVSAEAQRLLHEWADGKLSDDELMATVLSSVPDLGQ
jgi:hypothetical protein